MGGDSDSRDQAIGLKVFPEAAITEPTVFASSGKQTWDNGSLDSFYKPIDTYEGIHRFDPAFQWEPKEEKRLVRKLDRGNISQALSDDLLTDLKMTTNDYNTGQTIFFLCFLFAELPSQLISKAIGPDNWIPVQVSWSLVASCQAFMTGRSGFWTCRALLGLIEGGFIPDNVLYLSYWYTGFELPIRLSFFWVAYQSTSIISAFLAYGILHLRGVNGKPGWAWLFALEGMLTGLIGIVSYFYLPPSPTQTASWFRGKDGWFNEREEKILVNRVLRDDPSKGDMHNREALSLGMFWKCLKDYDQFPVYLLGLSWLIPATPITSYLTLQLKAVGFGTFKVQLLTVPAYVLYIINLLFFSWLSERLNERFLLATISQWWALALLIALEVLSADRSPWVAWVLSVLLYAMPYFHAVLVAVTSRNAGSVRTRTVATAKYNMCVQASSIVGTNIYREDDKPVYRRGNKILIAIVCYNIALFVGAKVFYVHVNKQRDRIWSAMKKEEKEEYLRTTKDEGNKRLDFRFAH